MQAAPGSTLGATQQKKKQRYSSRRTCRVTIYVEPDVPRTGERSGKQSNTGRNSDVLRCCTLLYRELQNECGVLLHTAVQRAIEYLRWFYGQRTCLFCVSRMQSGFIVSGNTVRFVDAAAALRELRVPPKK